MNKEKKEKAEKNLDLKDIVADPFKTMIRRTLQSDTDGVKIAGELKYPNTQTSKSWE